MLIYYFFVQIKRKHYVHFIRQTGLNSKERFDDYLFAKISKLLRSIYCFKMYFSIFNFYHIFAKNIILHGQIRQRKCLFPPSREESW